MTHDLVDGSLEKPAVEFLFALIELVSPSITVREVKFVQLGCFHKGFNQS